MRLRVDHRVEREHILWAAYQVALVAMPLTMRNVLGYLRRQIQMFGSDTVSLMGPNWTEPDEYEDKDWGRALDFVDKKRKALQSVEPFDESGC